MADFKPKKLDLTQINGGKEYEDRQGIHPIAINAPIEASAWVQMLAETQPDTSEANNVGTPSVSIEYDTNGYPYFKFANLKGETGTAEGESFLTKTEADETYLPKPNSAQANKEIYTLPVINDDGTVSTIVFQRSAVMGFGVVPSSDGYNIVINPAPATNIERRVDRSPITPQNLNTAVKMAITGQQRPTWAAEGKEITYGNQIALTDEEKASAQAWLGIKKYYAHALIFHKSGSLSFTVDRITSEPTAYLNCTTPMASNLFCTNSKSIVLNGITDISGVKSGVGTLMATMAPYDDENGENSGVKLSGVWINYATGEVSQVSNFEVPFEQDVVTEL